MALDTPPVFCHLHNKTFKDLTQLDFNESNIFLIVSVKLAYQIPGEANIKRNNTVNKINPVFINA